EIDGIIGNEIVDVTNTTLTRTGTGVVGDEFTVAVATEGITANELANNAVTSIKITDGAVSSNKILDGTIINADVSPTANIAGTKINPDFGAQNVSTTGTLTTTGTATIGANTITNVDGTSGQILTTDGAGVATWEDPATSIPMGTAGSIFFSDGASGLIENNTELFWDSTNNRFGIGTNTGLLNKLTVDGSIRTSGLTNSPGTTGQPSYRFSDDANTGMWQGGNVDFLRFSTGGVEAVTIDPSQNVGIGTATPNESLHVANNMQLDGSFKDKDGDTGTNGQVLTSTATGTDWQSVPTIAAIGMVNFLADPSASPMKLKGATVTKSGVGEYVVTFTNPRPDPLYNIQLSLLGSRADVIRIFAPTLADAPNLTRFTVQTFKIQNTNNTPTLTTSTGGSDSHTHDITIAESETNLVPADASWYFTVTDF
ncbi:hypothetical protein, partial [Cellulophaga baltica]